jgi:hypothetical protein
VRRCSVEGCDHYSKKGGVCIRHGAKIASRECIEEGCSKKAQNGGKCYAHGAYRKTCVYKDCTSMRRKGIVCKRHARELEEDGKDPYSLEEKFSETQMDQSMLVDQGAGIPEKCDVTAVATANQIVERAVAPPDDVQNLHMGDGNHVQNVDNVGAIRDTQNHQMLPMQRNSNDAHSHSLHLQEFNPGQHFGPPPPLSEQPSLEQQEIQHGHSYNHHHLHHHHYQPQQQHYHHPQQEGQHEEQQHQEKEMVGEHHHFHSYNNNNHQNHQQVAPHEFQQPQQLQQQPQIFHASQSRFEHHGNYQQQQHPQDVGASMVQNDSFYNTEHYIQDHHHQHHHHHQQHGHNIHHHHHHYHHHDHDHPSHPESEAERMHQHALLLDQSGEQATEASLAAAASSEIEAMGDSTDAIANLEESNSVGHESCHVELDGDHSHVQN